MENQWIKNGNDLLGEIREACRWYSRKTTVPEKCTEEVIAYVERLLAQEKSKEAGKPEWIEVNGGRYCIENGRLLIDLVAPHSQCLPYFNQHDITQITPGETVKYQSPTNVCGHQQRSLLVSIALRSFIESGGYPTIDAGGGGICHPGSISVDWIGVGEEPAYGGKYEGVNIKADASSLENFGSNSFSCIMSNHLSEHFSCLHYATDVPWQEKLRVACPGYELIDIIRGPWHRILRAGGYVAMIIPDEDMFLAGGGTSLGIDPTHNHAYGASTFKARILSKLIDLFDIVQYDTLDNGFSFDTILKKK